MQQYGPLSIKKNMLWNSIGSLCNLGCQWLISVLIVRLSNGYDAAGIYSLGISTYNIFGSIAQYRMYTYQVSDVKNENTTGEYLTFRLITGLSALVLCSIYGVATCSPVAWATIALYALYKTTTLIIDVFHACDQRFYRMDFIGISLALQGAISLACFVLAFGFTGSVELALILMTLGICLVGSLYDFRRTSSFERIKLGISCQKTIYLLAKCLPVVIAGIAASATSSLPRQALSSIMGNTVLGSYASVAAPVAIIQMGASYIYNPMLGYFSERFAVDDLAGFRQLLAKTVGGILIVGACCVVGFTLVGSQFLMLVFGESILDYVYLLVPMVISSIVSGVQWFINDLLIALRSFRPTLVSAIVSLVVTLVLENLFIIQYGPNGVTLTNMVASLISLAIMGYALSSLVRIKR